VSVSAYSNIALVRSLAPLMGEGGAFLSLSYLAGERVIPGYGGGMSSAKAALEADTRTLAFEAGRRWGVRVNAISAGPWASRAATAIGFIQTMIGYTSANSPLPRPIQADDVGHTAAFLLSPLAGAITGSVVYVDNGYHAMGMAVPESASGSAK
jgi:enoyl-[acyl-carrier protein] reductase I